MKKLFTPLVLVLATISANAQSSEKKNAYPDTAAVKKPGTVTGSVHIVRPKQDTGDAFVLKVPSDSLRNRQVPMPNAYHRSTIENAPMPIYQIGKVRSINIQNVKKPKKSD
ncbi:hypothetical protein [Pedobacter sp. JY14-1]|uniref:hypothetical protein n=1 Tax=Pedobacter sp. JY14-1 TaxID=3034151 RepID=UPI0023E0E114|nr:hypothetical protein [Pedobacter sp. JY14-1]